MDLVCVGLNHRSSPVEIREQVAFGGEQLAGHLKSLVTHPSVKEGVILSTCNRAEIYAHGEMAQTARDLRCFFHHQHGLRAGTLDDHLVVHHGAEAVRHLFRVASSLDAMVVGEPQILGQVKEAFRAAVHAGTVGPMLCRAFHHAFSVAKRVRSQTCIGQSAVSVSHAAVELARTIFGCLHGTTCLLVGAGSMAELAARHFVQDGAELVVVNRSLGRAEALAASFGGKARALSDLPRLLGTVDVVLTSTTAPQFLVSRQMVREALRVRRFRPLFFIDIAVPRNVDPCVAQLDNAYVYDVDDLSRVVADNLDKRHGEAGKAEALVGEEVQRFEQWSRALSVVPTIKALRARAQALADAEVQKTLSVLRPDLSEKERRSVVAMGNALVNKILHEPMSALRAACSEDRELVLAVQKLFNLAVMDDPEGVAAAMPVTHGTAAAAVEQVALSVLAAAEEAEAVDTKPQGAR